MPLIYFVQLHVYWLLLLLFYMGLQNVAVAGTSSMWKQRFEKKKYIIGEIIVWLLALYVCVIKYQYNEKDFHSAIGSQYSSSSSLFDERERMGRIQEKPRNTI